ncbi:MAG: hypothetical protein ACJ0BI_01995 [Paracoccaceae bacterium]
MKKLLLTTTALAGMSGVAFADISFSGGANINYKTAAGGVDGTFSQDANLTATMSSGGAYSASVGVPIGEGATTNLQTVTITTPMATISVDAGGDLADASSAYTEVSGMAGMGSTENENTDVSISASLGDISASFSGDTTLSSGSSSFGATGSLAGLAFTFGSENEDMGISLSGSALGGTVTVAMEEIGTASNSGVSLAIPVSGSTLTLTADDTAGVDGWSAKVATTVNGASVTVGTNDAGTTTVDVSAPIAGGATFIADYSTAANNSEYGVSYDLGGGATFLLSHSEFAATNTDTYAAGTNMKLSFAF